MTRVNKEFWAQEFQSFIARFQIVFNRKQTQHQGEKYLMGLLSNEKRKTCWQLAEITGDSIPDATQRLLNRSFWDEESARDILQDFVFENLLDPDGIIVFDETGFIKKGTKSAGVQRQYTGTAGKIENCQIGVFMTYYGKKGHTFLDRRLYLPESWAEDRKRCQEAKIPEHVHHRTKQSLAIDMLHHLLSRHASAPFRWVTGDEIYGSHDVRDAVVSLGKTYVFAVNSSITVFPHTPNVVRAEGISGPKGGRPRIKDRLARPSDKPIPVRDLVLNAKPSDWKRFSVGNGEKGAIMYDWLDFRILESRRGLPDRKARLIVRRSISNPEEIAYYLSNANERIPLKTLAIIASKRYSIEQCFEEGKGENGLDSYEVRYWNSWHRHITLSMMAHALLAVMRWKTGTKKNYFNPRMLN